MSQVVVAERHLHAEGRVRPIIVRVMMPRPSKKGDWECQYQALGIGNGRRRTAYGVDAVQALVLALTGLAYVVRNSGLEPAWEGGEPGDDGLPTFVPTYLGLAFAKRMSRLIEREVEKFATRQIKTRGQAGLRRSRGKVGWDGDLRQGRSSRFRNE